MEIFRKAALEKLSSPEQLDVMMTVTSPRGWIAIWAIGGILIFALVWSIFGAIPDKVSGSGIMIRGGAIYDVVALGSGRVAEMKVKPGDVVAAGDVVAMVSSPELQLRVSNLKGELAKLENEDKEMTAADQRSVELETEAILTERENLQRAKQDGLKMVGFLEQKVSAQEMLVEKGVLTKTALLSTRNELISAQQEIARADHQLSQTRSRESTNRNNVEERKQGRRRAVDDARRQLSEAESQLKLTGEVISPYAGRVLELMVDRGNIVQGGTRVVSLEDLEATLRAVIFIPAGDGKKVVQNMEIRISPTTAKREEYGALIGEVQSVADFPSTEEGVNRTLRNSQLARDLTGRGSVIEVFATLQPDPNTTSGYKWSSSSGPPLRVVSGTLANAEIVVGTQRPISIIIPFLKKQTGIY
jgi:HlyD family secretion protein